MTRLLYAIGRACSRHHYLVIAAWIVLAAALFVAGQRAEGQTNDNLTLPGTGSTIATELLEDNIPGRAYGANPLTIVAPEGKFTDPKYQEAIAATVKRLEAIPYVSGLVDPLSEEGKVLFSEDGRIVYIPVYLSISPGDLSESEAQRVLDAAEPAEAAGLEASIGSYVGSQLSQPSTESSDVIGLAAAVVILLISFGTATAMSLPIVSAILGLATSLSIIRLLEGVIQVPSIATTLATMIGLGVGIDYALFIVTRHKQQLAEGLEMRESIARAVATAGGAVVFAGFTVVIALASLWVAGINIVSTLGFTAAVAVITSVGAAVTLLPALLGALGPRIDSLRVRKDEAAVTAGAQHGWRRWGERVAARPRAFGLAAVVALLVLAIPLLDLELGQNDVGAMPTSTTSRQSYDAISEGYGPGLNGPLLIATELGSAAEAETVLGGLQKAVKEDPDVGAVSEAALDEAGTVAVFSAISKSAPSADATVNLVERLRDRTIPAALSGSQAQAYVGGQTAGYIDLAAKISDKLPQMIATVIALAFLVLLIAFRSLLIPIKAAAMNLLSIGAAYGVLTAVFQWGWGASLIGLDGAIPIVSFVPLLMFAILFGLSMDYEVFLMTGISERYAVDGETRLAVVDGVGQIGRVIASAATIMFFVFASFVLNGNPVVKEFGVGLAVAIAIDVALVRFILVPAIMVIGGRRMWWLPGWLGRILPPFSIEGEQYFARRDAADRPD
ncbi:MAG: MMPL family transporter [Solirubrobacterales bacterium]